MQALRWPTSEEEHAYMLMRQKQNEANSRRNEAENWMWDVLKVSPFQWRRQAQWGYRLYDFWCHRLGVAVEVDGLGHDVEYDTYRDEYNFRRSGIVVLRVKNFVVTDASWCIYVLKHLMTWEDRRKAMGLFKASKASRRKRLKQSYPPSLLDRHVNYRISKPAVHQWWQSPA